jgi:hypothetical protein
VQFVRPYTYLFSRPDWPKSLLAQSLPLFVGSLLPIVVLGAWPVLGYFSGRFPRMIATNRPDDADVPPFRIDKLGEYLSRGGWPTLYLALQFVFWFACYLVSYVILVVTLFSGMGPDDPVFWASLVGWSLSMLLIYYVTTFLLWPFHIHAYLTGRFAFGDSIAFAREFFGTVGWATFGLSVPKVLLDVLTYTAGMALCCVGVFPAWAVILNAELHYQAQLYRLYLARGGTPVGGADVIVRDTPIIDLKPGT